jgi:hypothetical protein
MGYESSGVRIEGSEVQFRYISHFSPEDEDSMFSETLVLPHGVTTQKKGINIFAALRA